MNFINQPRIAITGHTGMVGRQLVIMMKKLGIEIYIVEKSLIQSDSNLLSKFIELNRVNIFIHTASPLYDSLEDESVQQQKFNALKKIDDNIFKSLKENGVPIFIYLTTSLIYGDTKSVMVTEDYFNFARNFDSRKKLYISAKRDMTDKILKEDKSGWFAIVLPNLVYRYSKHNHFVERILFQIQSQGFVNDECFEIDGKFQFIRVQDFVNWLTNLLLNERHLLMLDTGILNVGPKWVTNTSEIIRFFLELSNLPVPLSSAATNHQSSLICSDYAFENLSWRQEFSPMDLLKVEYFL